MAFARLRHARGAGLLLASLLVGLGIGSEWAEASGLQVAPTTLSLRASQNADGLWLSNAGDGVVHAQVRVYHWTQDDKGDQLVASRGLVVSPPMLQLAIDELPVATPDNAANPKRGLQFVLHYSVPIFVEPAGAAASPAQLQWSLQRIGEQAQLQVSNRGGSHAQLAGLNFIDKSGHRTEINPGLLGYVLPGATMRWMLKPSAAVFAAGGTLEAMINGEKATQNLALADRPR